MERHADHSKQASFAPSVQENFAVLGPTIATWLSDRGQEKLHPADARSECKVRPNTWTVRESKQNA
jgi:hypothetical protein